MILALYFQPTFENEEQKANCSRNNCSVKIICYTHTYSSTTNNKCSVNKSEWISDMRFLDNLNLPMFIVKGIPAVLKKNLDIPGSDRVGTS